MRAFPAIVLYKSAIEIARYTAVMDFIISLADEDVNIVKAFHRTVFVRGTMSKNGWPAKP
jgi:hypothetical protein